MARTNVTPGIIDELARVGGWWSSKNESRAMNVSVRYAYFLGKKGDTSRRLDGKQFAKFTSARSGRVKRMDDGTLRVVSEEERLASPGGSVRRRCLVCQEEFAAQGRFQRMHTTCWEAASDVAKKVFKIRSGR